MPKPWTNPTYYIISINRHSHLRKPEIVTRLLWCNVTRYSSYTRHDGSCCTITYPRRWCYRCCSINNVPLFYREFSPAVRYQHLMTLRTGRRNLWQGEASTRNWCLMASMWNLYPLDGRGSWQEDFLVRAGVVGCLFPSLSSALLVCDALKASMWAVHNVHWEASVIPSDYLVYCIFLFFVTPECLAIGGQTLVFWYRFNQLHFELMLIFVAPCFA